MTGKDAGFTLIEALTVLAIVAITLTIGIPTFSDTLRNYRVGTTLHLLGSDMAMARSTALMKRADVVVCPGTPASPCSGDQDWSGGWIVFTDADGDGAPNLESDVLRVAEPGNAAILYLPSSRAHLRYRPDGRAAGTNLTVNVCSDGQLAGQVIVNNLGRVRTERPANSSDCPPA